MYQMMYSSSRCAVCFENASECFLGLVCVNGPAVAQNESCPVDIIKDRYFTAYVTAVSTKHGHCWTSQRIDTLLYTSQRYRQNTDTAGPYRDNGNGRTITHKRSTVRRKALTANDSYNSSDVHFYFNGRFIFVAGSFSGDSKIDCAEVLDLITSFLCH